MNTFEKMTLIMDRQLSAGLFSGTARRELAESRGGDGGGSRRRFERSLGEGSANRGLAQSIYHVAVLGEN